MVTLTSLRFCLVGNNTHCKEQWNKIRLFHNRLHSWQKSSRECEVSSIGRVRGSLIFELCPRWLPRQRTFEVEAVAVRRSYSRDRHSALQGQGGDKGHMMLRIGSRVQQVALQQSLLGDQWDSLHSLKTSCYGLDVNAPHSIGSLNTWYPADGTVLKGWRIFGTQGLAGWYGSGPASGWCSVSCLLRWEPAFPSATDRAVCYCDLPSGSGGILWTRSQIKSLLLYIYSALAMRKVTSMWPSTTPKRHTPRLVRCDYAHHIRDTGEEVVIYIQGSLWCQIWGNQVRNQLRRVSSSFFDTHKTCIHSLFLPVHEQGYWFCGK